MNERDNAPCCHSDLVCRWPTSGSLHGATISTPWNMEPIRTTSKARRGYPQGAPQENPPSSSDMVCVNTMLRFHVNVRVSLEFGCSIDAGSVQ